MNDYPRYVIHRTSESRQEWWTGKDWSENPADAQRFDVKPLANETTGDESATVERLEMTNQIA